ncbi:MAG: hypothetical protein KC619_09300 [Myxococcales bacterium]|nr:hypothetical protein [Myxococcales bacterium]
MNSREIVELLRPAFQQVRAAFAEVLRDRDAQAEGHAVATRLPTSSRLIAHVVNGAGLRPVAVPGHMSASSFYNLLHDQGGRRVAGQLGRFVEHFVTGTLELERHERGDEIAAAVLGALDEERARYDALVETLAVCDVPDEQLARAILRTCLPDLAIRRAAILHILGEEGVSQAPLTDPRPMNAMLQLLWREAGLHRGAIVRVDPNDPDDRGVATRTLADWQSGRSLPSDPQIARAAAEIVTRASARREKHWREKQVRGWLRSARAAQYVRDQLEEALGPAVVADLLEGYEELTRLAFDVLGSSELEEQMVVLTSIAKIDSRQLLAQMNERARSCPSTQAMLDQLHDAGVTDPVAFVYGIGNALLQNEATREEGRRLLREAALYGALLGTSGVMGPWLCDSMARRTTSPGLAETLRSLRLRDWRDVVLDLATTLAVVQAAAAGHPELDGKAVELADRMLRFAA